MSRSLQLDIITPDRVVLREAVDYVSMTGVEGEFGVLPGHIPFLSALKIGPAHYIRDGKTGYFCVSGGFAEVAENTVLVLADAAELAGEIDAQRAGEARKRAEERLAGARAQAAGEGDIDMDRAAAALARAINRLKLSGMH